MSKWFSYRDGWQADPRAKEPIDELIEREELDHSLSGGDLDYAEDRLSRRASLLGGRRRNLTTIGAAVFFEAARERGAGLSRLLFSKAVAATRPFQLGMFTAFDRMCKGPECIPNVERLVKTSSTRLVRILSGKVNEPHAVAAALEACYIGAAFGGEACRDPILSLWRSRKKFNSPGFVNLLMPLAAWAGDEEETLKNRMRNENLRDSPHDQAAVLVYTSPGLFRRPDLLYGLITSPDEAAARVTNFASPGTEKWCSARRAMLRVAHRALNHRWRPGLPAGLPELYLNISRLAIEDGMLRSEWLASPQEDRTLLQRTLAVYQRLPDRLKQGHEAQCLYDRVVNAGAELKLSLTPAGPAGEGDGPTTIPRP